MVKRFDIVLIDFGRSIGSEQSSVRPAVVVGNEMGCMYSPVVIVMPFTSQLNKKNIPTHHIINAEPGGLKNDSLLIGEQPTPIAKSRIKKVLGHISNEMNQGKINQACYDAFFYQRGGQ